MNSNGRRDASTQEGELDLHDWGAFGLDPATAADWGREGFDAFQAALAHGDGFNLVAAVHLRKMVRRLALAWKDAGTELVEDLRWHRAGFTAKEANRYRARNLDVWTALAIRNGYLKGEP